MLKVKFWGVRGSIPASGDDTVYFGGNTSCIEVQLRNQLFIFDCGTGLRPLSAELLKHPPVSGNIFISHLHWDHIQGFPFFVPAMVPGNRFDIFAPPRSEKNIQHMLERLMDEPNFPVPLSIMKSILSFHDVHDGKSFSFDGVRVTAAKVNHPGITFAYRIESDDFSMVYATDTEHLPEGIDQNLLNFARNADLLIYDAQYLPEEYNGENGNTSKKGWGHSTMVHGATLAKEANVAQLVLFHHDPSHADNAIFGIEREAKKLFPSTVAAFDGMTITREKGKKKLAISSRGLSGNLIPFTSKKEQSLRKLIEVSMEISGEGDLDNLLNLIAMKSMDITASDGVTIYLKEKDPKSGKDVLSIKTVLNQSIDIPNKFKLDINAGSIAGYVAMTGNILQIDNAYKISESLPYRFNPEIDRKYRYKTVSMLVLPITNYKKELIGVIQLVNRKKDAQEKISHDSSVEKILPYNTDCEDFLKSLSVLAGGALEKVMMIYEMKNAMQRLEETQSMLIQQEKLASLGTMATGLAHELSQPLSNISLLSSLLIEKVKTDKLDQKDAEEKLSLIEQQCKRMVTLVDHLRAFSRKGSSKLNMQKISVREVLDSTLLLIKNELQKHNVSLKVHHESNLPLIHADANQLEQVFINIINNAKDALADSGQKKREISISFYQEDSMLAISFSDTGNGMSEDTLKKIFTPFFTTKESGKGTGIGLFICYGIVEKHKGKIEVSSEAGKGTNFTVKLPIEEGVAEAAN